MSLRVLLRMSGLVLALTMGASASQAQSPAAMQPLAQPPAQPLAEASAPRVVKLDGRALPLGGALAAPQLWAQYKRRFITPSGRVVDSANGFISHSEGQGYGMLLAVAANDRMAFERLWGWTRANLMVRDDQLVAWRWEPGQRPAVSDMNNATDGDILIAWALAEAAEFWADASHRAAGRRIAVEIGRKLALFKTGQGALLLPGVAGFSADERPDGPVVNLSYYVFPAFGRLGVVAPEIDWPGLMRTGLDQIRAARFGPSELPSDWISLRDGAPRPADGFPPQFSYNAIRIPLYLAFAGLGDWEHYRAFHAWSTSRRALATIDVKTGREVERLSERGYASLAALLACVIDRTPVGPDFRTASETEHYYPATLHLLAVAAANLRYQSCAKG